MTASELRELEEYYQIEPFGEYRHELRHGQSMALTLNLNRDEKQRRNPFTALECMNFVNVPEQEAPEESPEVLSARISQELFGIA